MEFNSPDQPYILKINSVNVKRVWICSVIAFVAAVGLRRGYILRIVHRDPTHDLYRSYGDVKII